MKLSLLVFVGLLPIAYTRLLVVGEWKDVPTEKVVGPASHPESKLADHVVAEERNLQDTEVVAESIIIDEDGADKDEEEEDEEDPDTNTEGGEGEEEDEDEEDNDADGGLNTITEGDPHFKTWGGKWYDYHGQCDLVMLKIPEFEPDMGLDIHVRTTIRKLLVHVLTVALLLRHCLSIFLALSLFTYNFQRTVLYSNSTTTTARL